MIELRGRDVLLRPLAVEDAVALAAAASESRENYLYNPVPDGEEQAKQYIERALMLRDRGERMPFVIIFLGKVVGTTSYAKLETWEWPQGSARQRRNIPDVVEIGGTWLAQSAQRTRCNTEAKFLLMSHAFDIWNVYRVSFRTDKRNERSRRAIERLRAKFEGIRRADMPSTDGNVRDSAYYSITLEEWPEVRSHILTLLDAQPPIIPPDPP